MALDLSQKAIRRLISQHRALAQRHGEEDEHDKTSHALHVRTADTLAAMLAERRVLRGAVYRMKRSGS